MVHQQQRTRPFSLKEGYYMLSSITQTKVTSDFYFIYNQTEQRVNNVRNFWEKRHKQFLQMYVKNLSLSILRLKLRMIEATHLKNGVVNRLDVSVVSGRNRLSANMKNTKNTTLHLIFVSFGIGI